MASASDKLRNLSLQSPVMRSNNSILDTSKILLRLSITPATSSLTKAWRVVAGNRKLIRKAMRMGHSLETLSKELQLPKRTLQRHLNEAGLFYRKPRTKKGHAVKRNLTAISRAKLAAGANV